MEGEEHVWQKCCLVIWWTVLSCPWNQHRCPTHPPTHPPAILTNNKKNSFISFFPLFLSYFFIFLFNYVIFYPLSTRTLFRVGGIWLYLIKLVLCSIMLSLTLVQNVTCFWTDCLTNSLPIRSMILLFLNNYDIITMQFRTAEAAMLLLVSVMTSKRLSHLLRKSLGKV